MVLSFRLSENRVALSSRHREKAFHADAIKGSVRILPMGELGLQGIHGKLQSIAMKADPEYARGGPYVVYPTLCPVKVGL